MLLSGHNQCGGDHHGYQEKWQFSLSHEPQYIVVLRPYFLGKVHMSALTEGIYADHRSDHQQWL
jgi:hypothetical protein